jgi:hypothetical protein
MSVVPGRKAIEGKVARRLAVIMALMLGALGVSAAPAMAATSTNGARSHVNVDKVCQHQDHTAASLKPWNPTWSGWYCVDFSISLPKFEPSLAPAGGLDVNKYCHDVYPGTKATILNISPEGWYCVA